MSSKEEDNKQTTSTPRTQQKTRQENRELSKLRAEANSPNVAKLVPLGSKKSSLALVSPELSYAEKLKGGNKSEPKEKEDTEEEEEEEGEEEGEKNKKAGDKEKEDPKDSNDSSNSTNNNMSINALAALAPFDLELTHVLTIVCAFPNNSKPVQAVREFGITDFDNFRSIEYDHKWEYDNSGSQEIVTGNYGMILSTIIAYARDMETQQHADKDSPLNWTHEQFNLWRRTEYSTWKQSGAAAAASGTPTRPNNVSRWVSVSSNVDSRSRLYLCSCAFLSNFFFHPKKYSSFLSIS